MSETSAIQRPSTSCQMRRNLDRETVNNGLSRSYTFAEDKSTAVLPSSSPKKQARSTQNVSLLNERIGYNLLSNDNWRRETVDDLRLNSKVIEQSDQNILYGKGVDPLPHVKELLNELSNDQAFLYARQCRLVVAKLRLCWSDVNEEIKSLSKHKEYTEAALDHIRKDLIINKESVDIRKKPPRESEPDGVDDMLSAEKYHLVNLKKILELNCKNVVDQMQRLDEVRTRVAKIGKERSLVTELICQCLTQASRTFEISRNEKLSNLHQQTPRTAPVRSKSASGFKFNRHAASSSSTINLRKISPEATLLDENGLPLTGNLSAFTPDVINVFKDASKLIEESREIKKQVIRQIKDAFNEAKSCSLTVHQSLAQRLADIITLAQNLTISLGENSLAQNRAQRWLELTIAAQNANSGPVSSFYLKTAERLDRPIIRTFQRHPGNQLSEAKITIKSTQSLAQSALETAKQIHTLKIVGQRLQNNLIDKEVALSVDSNLLRRRRERSNHKWNVTKYVHV
ncbi:unnamed protein product [Didymodactylos carnosus]|uniref:Coiled-coil domain-containing protein n=1 Tax=Didymodactylos carnosus TaxID=1234261 RepID=A0A813QV02_9BILA|nr:unnamed protein product [Didymodactylos carnosus]CAF1016102.1 unnamed protein product [Didymodactylos carnosus]CAF3554669.1 unnamed protein product [Didymodactylos carnosus]CAF3785172.1 unnamed protein product [Didymodactylos carnosus]